MIFDEPISHGLLLIDKSPSSGRDAFNKSNETNTERKRVVQNNFERPGKTDISFIDSMQNNDFQMKYSFEKEFPRIITNTLDATSKSILQYEQSRLISFYSIVRKT